MGAHFVIDSCTHGAAVPHVCTGGLPGVAWRGAVRGAMGDGLQRWFPPWAEGGAPRCGSNGFPAARPTGAASPPTLFVTEEQEVGYIGVRIIGGLHCRT